MARNKYDVDENLEVKFDFGQVKRLGKYLKPFKKKLILVVAVMLSASAASMLLPRFFMTVMDEYIPNKDMHGLLMVALATLAITIYVAVALRIKIKITTTIGQSVTISYGRIFFHTCRNCRFPTMTAGLTAKSRCAWSTM